MLILSCVTIVDSMPDHTIPDASGQTHVVNGGDWSETYGIDPEDYAHMAHNFMMVTTEIGRMIAIAHDIDFRAIINNLSTFNKPGATDAYWRGLAALFIAGYDHNIEPEDVPGCLDFIDWSGDHPDLSSAIYLAKERGTINVTDLKQIADDQSRSGTPLKEGVL